MDRLVAHLRHTLRRASRSPGFTLVVVLTLAVGIGTETAVFRVVDGVLLRPLPFRDADALTLVTHHPAGRTGDRVQISLPLFRALHQATSDVPAAAVVATLTRMVGVEAGEARPVRVAPVSGEFFGVMGISASRGSTFGPEHDRTGAERVLVVSWKVWSARFGGDPDVVGRTWVLDGTPYRILGVLPPGAVYPPTAEAWTPVASFAGDAATDAGVGFLEIVARIPGDRDPTTVAGELEAAGRRVLAAQAPEAPALRVRMTPLQEALRGPVRPVLLALLAGASLVFLAACSNVDNLLRGRAGRRRREWAVRRALGAGRPGLLTGIAVEGGALVAAAGLLGVPMSRLVVTVLLALGPTPLPGAAPSFPAGPATVFFAAGVTVAAWIVTTVGPWLRMGRGAPARELRATAGAGDGPTGSRARGVGVAVQVAVATVVIAAAGLTARSSARLRGTDLGFRRQGTVSVELVPPPEGWSGPGGGDTFVDRLVERVEGLPGVERAAGVLLRPLQGPRGFDYPFTVEGQTPEEQAANPLLVYEAVTPGFFEASGVPLLRGRGFTAADREDAPAVAVVSRSLAESRWPGEDPLGRRLKWGGPGSTLPWITVVGVAGDARYRSLRAPGPVVYVPHRQSPWPLRHLVVRVAAGDPRRVVAGVRREVRSLAPGAHVMAAATPDELAAAATGGSSYAALLVTVRRPSPSSSPWWAPGACSPGP